MYAYVWTRDHSCSYIYAYNSWTPYDLLFIHMHTIHGLLVKCDVFVLNGPFNNWHGRLGIIKSSSTCFCLCPSFLFIHILCLHSCSYICIQFKDSLLNVISLCSMAPFNKWHGRLGIIKLGLPYAFTFKKDMFFDCIIIQYLWYQWMFFLKSWHIDNIYE